jgi:hypothetical protein
VAKTASRHDKKCGVLLESCPKNNDWNGKDERMPLYDYFGSETFGVFVRSCTLASEERRGERAPSQGNALLFIRYNVYISVQLIWDDRVRTTEGAGERWNAWEREAGVFAGAEIGLG